MAHVTVNRIGPFHDPGPCPVCKRPCDRGATAEGWDARVCYHCLIRYWLRPCKCGRAAHPFKIFSRSLDAEHEVPR